MGSDIKEGLSRASVSNRKKSNLFSRGYEGGINVTIGASHNGRIWAHQIATDLSEWVEWCQHIGTKLLDDSISTEKILEHVIIPEVITDRPKLVPLIIEWPTHFLMRSDETVQVEVDGLSVPFYQAELAITSFSDTGPIQFCIRAADTQIDYEVVFNGDVVKYLPTTGSDVYLVASGHRETMTEWFQEEFPIITFEDTSKLEYNEIFRPKTDREPYDASEIDGWDWSGITLTRESQYKAVKEPPRLEFRRDSIQRYLIDKLLAGYFVNYDIIFDDDDAGEIADVIALKAAGDNLLVHLFHCKYSKSIKAGARVSDFYEVCGQAQKSVYWRREIKKLFARLKLREMQRQGAYGLSRFEKGDLIKLDELRRRSRELYPEFHIYIVQPGLIVQEVDLPILDLLGATELYLRETFDAPLSVIANKE